MCVFFGKNDQRFNKTNISHCCKEQDLDICAIQLATKTVGLIILSMYRAPSGAKETRCNIKVSIQSQI
jgi:hypothetical protein